MSSIQWKDINRLAIPAIIAGIAEPVISLVDTAVVGRLGATELGGVGVGSSLFTLLMWILAQTKSAISAIVSRHYGEKRLKQLQRFVPQALLLNFLLGVLIVAATLPFLTTIFSWYNAKGELLETASNYYGIRALGLPFGLFVFGVFGVFRGLQNTSWAMQISFAGAFLNIVLDLLLVFGIEGVIPAFGVKGAALASVCAQVLMFMLSLVFLYRKTQFKLFLALRIHPKIGKLLRMSLDLFLRAGALNVAFYVGTSFSTSYGDEVVAAFTIGTNIWLFSSFFIDGYSNAGNALSGRLAGEGNLKELKRVGFQLVKINLVIASLLSLSYALLYPFMGSFFTASPRVLLFFNATFWLIIVSQPINALAFTMDGIYKGLGKTAFLRNLLIGATFLAFLPAVFILDTFVASLWGIWLSFIIWMSARSFPLLIDFKRLKHV